MMRSVMALATALLLSACSTTGTKLANEMMAAQYIGQPADSFFLKYGPPKTTFELDNGQTMYVWAENPTVYGGGLNVQTLPATATVDGSGTVVQCEVRIVADKSGTILQILAQNDTIGNWQLSRCKELFSQKG